MNRPLMIAGLFTVNFCSLVFEVVASRKAATYLGATAYANSALLAAFLAGIGLGGWMASWASISNARRVRLCGFLLIIAALLSAVFAPAITWLIDAGPAGLIARGGVLALLVIPVGLAVGFSYPVMTGLLADSGAIGQSVATSYAADTIGASFGALAAGLFLVPAVGLRLTGVFAGIGLACVGILLVATRSAAPVRDTPRSTRGAPAVTPARLLLGLFFFTGLAALSLEVAWIRLFTLVIGTSIFSFSLTVAAFLAALGIGSQLVRKRADGFTDPASMLARILILTGALAPALLLLTPAWERIYLAAYQSTTSVLIFQLTVFGLGLLSILLPAGLMGAGFSLGVRLVHPPDADPAVSTGRLYGINTIGGVIGAILAGLLLLPTFGVRGTILMSAAIYVLAGVVLSVKSVAPSKGLATRLTAVGAFGVLMLVWVLPEPLMFFAPYFHGIRLGSFASFAKTRAQEHVIYRRFSPYGLVTVSEDATYRYLRHNGRSEASTSPLDMSTQLLIAHLPLLMHPAPARVMNIGLGAGFTLGGIKLHPEVKAIVQAELDPRILEAASTRFAEVNNDALNDSRLTVAVTDGRKLLADESARYDVIISEPSHLWVSGVSGLFTREFYRIVASRLAPGGIFATWVPRYELSPADIQIVAATLLREFPHVTAFENGPADIIFFASGAPFRPDLERTRAALSVAGISRDFTRALEGFPLSPENLNNLLVQVAANADLMPQSVTADTPLNADDWPVLEFHTALTSISKRWHETGQSP